MKNKPTIADIAPVVMEYYSKPGNNVGGSLHIVLEDGNIKDSDVLFCIKQAEESGDTDGADLGYILLSMSKTQRLKLSAMQKSINHYIEKEFSRSLEGDGDKDKKPIGILNIEDL